MRRDADASLDLDQAILRARVDTCLDMRKAAGRMPQSQLPLDIVNKNRFDKIEAAILNGQDLDLPTFIRRGVVLK